MLSGETIFIQSLQLLRQKGTKPVFQITMGVDSPLEGVDQVMADFIAKKLASIEKQGITIWFRWLWEMNGNWRVAHNTRLAVDWLTLTKSGTLGGRSLKRWSQPGRLSTKVSQDSATKFPAELA